VLSVSDGVNLLSGLRIVSGTIKVTIEEAGEPETFQAWIDSQPVQSIDVFCADPLPPRYEINFHVPEQCPAGSHLLHMQLGGRKLAPVGVEVA
jgi:hypothetical protein